VVPPAVVVDATTLLLAVLVVGAANGALDIAMNAQGIAVERAATRRLFNFLHAGFSFGALAGAGLAAAAAAAGVPPLPHLAATAAAGAVIALVLARGLLPDRGAADARRIACPTRRLATLGVVAFCALLAEGAVFDWTWLCLKSSIPPPQSDSRSAWRGVRCSYQRSMSAIIVTWWSSCQPCDAWSSVGSRAGALKLPRDPPPGRRGS
jgi:hypothetical protein